MLHHPTTDDCRSHKTQYQQILLGLKSRGVKTPTVPLKERKKENIFQNVFELSPIPPLNCLRG